MQKAKPNVLILMITAEEQKEFQNLEILDMMQTECNLKVTNAESFEQGERHLDSDIVIANLYGVNDDEIQKHIDFYMFYCQPAANIAWICHTEEDDQYAMIQTMNAKSKIHQVPDESANEAAEILGAFNAAQETFSAV
jgi:agmatine/peptidylarginine deiminase